MGVVAYIVANWERIYFFPMITSLGKYCQMGDDFSKLCRYNQNFSRLNWPNWKFSIFSLRHVDYCASLLKTFHKAWNGIFRTQVPYCKISFTICFNFSSQVTTCFHDSFIHNTKISSLSLALHFSPDFHSCMMPFCGPCFWELYIFFRHTWYAFSSSFFHSACWWRGEQKRSD